MSLYFQPSSSWFLAIVYKAALKYPCADFCAHSFKSICVNTKEHDFWIKCKSTFTLINWKTPPKLLYHSTFPIAMMRVPIALHPHQTFLVLVLGILDILIRSPPLWYLIVLTYNSLQTYDMENIFLLLSLFISLMRYLFRHLGHILIRCFVFLLSFESSLYILGG